MTETETETKTETVTRSNSREHRQKQKQHVSVVTRVTGPLYRPDTVRQAACYWPSGHTRGPAPEALYVPNLACPQALLQTLWGFCGALCAKPLNFFPREFFEMKRLFASVYEIR